MDQAMIKDAIEIFRKVVTEHYVDFKGRSSRKEFWTYFAVAVVLGIAVAIVTSIIFLPLLSSLFSLALILPSSGIAVRRLHDVGKDGTIVLICAGLSVVVNLITLLTSSMFGAFGAVYALLAFGWLISLISLVLLGLAIYILYLASQPGVSGDNQYGPQPAA